MLNIEDISLYENKNTRNQYGQLTSFNPIKWNYVLGKDIEKKLLSDLGFRKPTMSSDFFVRNMNNYIFIADVTYNPCDIYSFKLDDLMYGDYDVNYDVVIGIFNALKKNDTQKLLDILHEIAKPPVQGIKGLIDTYGNMYNWSKLACVQA